MQLTQPIGSRTENLPCILVEPTRSIPDIVDDVRDGLLSPPRSLPPKYFYDAYGSNLFDQICDTPEYYPTRTEDRLLSTHSKTIIRSTQPDQILEFGSGTARKTRRLFDACESIAHRCEYAPFDVCTEILEDTQYKLQSDYTWLQVHPLVGDYHAGLGNLPQIKGTRLFVFLGSTIGNFDQDEALAFLHEVSNCMKPGDYLLLGADRIKDRQVLDAAYNDNQGITANFNLNVLRVLNRELDADFDLDGFEHRAGFNSEQERIEMYLVSTRDQTVHLAEIDEVLRFKPGDEILTEVSHKYSFDGIESILEQSSFRIIQHHEPDNRYFSLILAKFNQEAFTE